MSYVYVASPYSHKSTLIRWERYQAVKRYMVHLFRSEVAAYSPIMHWHQAAVEYDLPGNFDPWKAQDEAMLMAARHLYVLGLPGWTESRGVQSEIKLWRAYMFGEPYIVDPREPFNVEHAPSLSRVES